MKVLIIHNDAAYFAGAETMLLYFLRGAAAAGLEVAVAGIASSKLWDLIPAHTLKLEIPANQPFSPIGLWRQANAISHLRSHFDFELVHAWAARSWDTAVLAGFLARRPTLGTLHDHPQAPFHSKQRRFLMRSSVRTGLRAVTCVSEAVRNECLACGYPAQKLEVIRNGLPVLPLPAHNTATGLFRFGFLGVFSERKGLRGLMSVLDELARIAPGADWRATMAGGALDSGDQSYFEKIQAEFSTRTWWGRVEWPGWIKETSGFFQTLDLLVLPSQQFDPFPTVLLEAGRAGVPALAANVGGVPEIIEDGSTGWLFPAGNWVAAAHKLAELANERAGVRSAGEEAAGRVRTCFSVDRMVEEYQRLYRRLAARAEKP